MTNRDGKRICSWCGQSAPTATQHWHWAEDGSHVFILCEVCDTKHQKAWRKRWVDRDSEVQTKT
jgi:RNase P subunit RPR2